MWHLQACEEVSAAADAFVAPQASAAPTVDAVTLHWCALAALDVIGLPLVVVDADGRVWHTNRSAQRLLAPTAVALVKPTAAGSNGLHWHLTPQHHLALTDATQQHKWRQALRMAAGAQRCSLLSSPAQTKTDLSSAPSHAMVLPIHSWGGQAPAAAADKQLVLVLLAACGWPGEVSFQLWASQHRLTDTESRVLKQVCMGLSPRQIAQAHQVALSTITTQLASVRAKTGCRSLRGLAQWVTALPHIEPAGGRQLLC